MARFCRSGLAFLLKFFNFLQTFVGVSILLYALWLLTLWRRHGSPLDVDNLPAPWFLCGAMGVGILLCLIALTGHVAAETINGCCLCFYAAINSTLIILEASLFGIILLNKHWEEDLPYDSTGELKRLRAFIVDNMDICKWVAVSVIVVQAISLLLAVVIRAMLPNRRVDHDSDDDFVVIRRPLLNPQGDPVHGTIPIDNIWSPQSRQKYVLNQNEASIP